MKRTFWSSSVRYAVREAFQRFSTSVVGRSDRQRETARNSLLRPSGQTWQSEEEALIRPLIVPQKDLSFLFGPWAKTPREGGGGGEEGKSRGQSKEGRASKGTRLMSRGEKEGGRARSNYVGPSSSFLCPPSLIPLMPMFPPLPPSLQGGHGRKRRGRVPSLLIACLLDCRRRRRKRGGGGEEKGATTFLSPFVRLRKVGPTRNYFPVLFRGGGGRPFSLKPSCHYQRGNSPPSHQVGVGGE